MSGRPDVSKAPKRTQVERRQAMQRKLLDATEQCLAERGYAGTTTSAICKAAGVSQGALFRHFPTRLHVIAAATEAIGGRHVEALRTLEDFGGTGLALERLVSFVRETTRSDAHAAWHEVMVAARTDSALNAAVAPVLRAYESALNGVARSLCLGWTEDVEHAEMVVLSVLHMLDSEAVTRRVHRNRDVEERRLAWVIALLKQELWATEG